jgi:hypothetical protein
MFQVGSEFSPLARGIGIFSSSAVVALQLFYAVALFIGFRQLDSENQQVADPIFTLLEFLIILMMPIMVTLMASVHAWTAAQKRLLSLTSLLFMSMAATITCTVHFLILTLSRQPEFSSLPEVVLLFSFTWPSFAYSLDILAWDFFFALSMLFAAPVFADGQLARWIRALMTISGILALAGLTGAAVGDMQLRNIGILGYLVVFLVVAALLGVLFYQTKPVVNGA